MKVICTKNKFGFTEGMTYECDKVYACTYFGNIREESWVYRSKDDDFVLFDFKEYINNFQEVKETKKPKWKVGDYVVKLPGKPSKYPNEISYMKISSIENGNLHEQTGEFLYDGLYESCYRDPTEEELSLYFR